MNTITAKTPWKNHMGDVPMHLDYFEGSMFEMVEQAAKPFEVAPGVIASVGLSVGSAELVGAGLNAADAVRAADRALYRAKAEGKGRYIGASASA